MFVFNPSLRLLRPTSGRLSRHFRSQKQSQKQLSEAGYSLLEILVVLAIISILMATVAPRLMGNVDKSKVVAAKAQVKTLRLALDSYKLDTGSYPSQSEGLEALITKPQGSDNQWYGPYLESDLPSDPWGHSYIYEMPAAEGGVQRPKVVSLGADNAPGGDGLNADIRY